MSMMEGLNASSSEDSPLLRAMSEAEELAAYNEGFPSVEAMMRTDAHLAEPYKEAAAARFFSAVDEEAAPGEV